MDTVQASTGIGDVELPARVSARGVISGLLVGLAFEVMLLVLGGAVGMSAIQRGADVGDRLGDRLGRGFAAWPLIAFVISTFVAGWVATGAARAIRRRDGVLHGLVTWAAVVLVALTLVGAALRGTGLGAWALFLALALSMIAAIIGGVIAAGRERRVAGLPSQRALRRRKPIVSSPTHTSQVPARPLPST